MNFLKLIGLYNTGVPNTARRLASKATARTHQAFRPATQASYTRKFRLFVAYCCFIGVHLQNLTPLIAMSFLEFLVENNLFHSAIANYLSAVKANLALYGLPLYSFQDPRITYFQKSLSLHKTFAPVVKKIIDIPLLASITSICDTMWMGQIFKALYLTAFFSFLRISNLVPHSIKAFSPIEQMARGDVFFAPPGIHLLIKWSKTIQTRDTIRILKIPSLGSSPLCPVQAIKNLLLITPGTKNDPLFQIKNEAAQWVPLTDTKVRRNFTQILSRVGLQHSGMSLHTFRRSGATLAFNSNVSIQNIQSHGTWTSDCVWRYIIQDHNASQQVADSFKSLLHRP